MAKKASAPATETTTETPPDAELVRRAPAKAAEAKKPRNRFGNIRQLPSGRWQVRYRIGTTYYTAPHTFVSERAAKAYRDKRERELYDGEWAPPPKKVKLTVAELLREWLESDPGKRTSSRQRDESVVRLVSPELARMQLREVTPKDIQAQIDLWHKPPGGPVRKVASVARMFSALRAAFSYAASEHYITDNPTVKPAGLSGQRRAKALPHLPEDDMVEVSAKEAATEESKPPEVDYWDAWFLATVVPDPYHLMVWLGLIAGLRWAEVAGLTVDSVDAQHSVLKIRRQLTREGTLAPLKTKAGNRDIHIPQGLADDLRGLIRERGISKNPLALLFVTPETDKRGHSMGERGGQPLSHTNWRRNVWEVACKACHYTNFTFHDLRRMNATLLVEEGANVKNAQARLGHQSATTTLDIYARAMTDADRETARKLGKKFHW